MLQKHILKEEIFHSLKINYEENYEGREKEKTQEINFEDKKQMSFRNETKY